MKKVQLLVLGFAILCVFLLIGFVVNSNSPNAWGRGPDTNFSNDPSTWGDALADPVRMSRYPWDEDL